MISKLGLKVLGVIFSIILIAFLFTHYRQWQAANEQEREIYISKSMAFTRAEFCGVPFTWPVTPVIPENEIVKLDIDPELRSFKNGNPYLSLPSLTNYQENGFDWRIYRDPITLSVDVKVRYAARPTQYLLQAKPTSDGAFIRILNTASNTVLYEQPLKVKVRRGGYKEFCPMPTTGWNSLTKGYDAALLQALNQQNIPTKRKDLLHAEIARESCNLGTENINGIDGLRTWDGRQVILQPESIRTRFGFCSENYIVLVYASSVSNTDPSDLSAIVQIFDRKTLRPLAAFNDRRVCPLVQCKEVSHEIVKGVQISNESVIVETAFGELHTKRIEI